MTQNIGEEGQRICCLKYDFYGFWINYLTEKMAETAEGDGTMLDNALLLLTSGRADFQGPHGSDYPIVLVGGSGGAIKTPGVHHRNIGGNTNDILVTFCWPCKPVATRWGKALL